MFRILKKERLNSEMHLIRIEAPLIAVKAEPGQFLILRIDEKGERIPLTIYEADKERGEVTLIFQEVGKTTHHLAMLKEDDDILDFIGPLGNPTHIVHYGNVVCIGGGVGNAELYPVSRGLYRVNNKITSILGFRMKELIVLEEEMEKFGTLFITTDDGSYGRKGFVTDVLKELLEEKEFDIAFCVGPLVMMKRVCEITRPVGLKTIVSLNSIMVDGTGMCGSCRVKIGGKMKFACVDGPDFDGHKVDFDELFHRQKRFLKEEKTSLEIFEKGEKHG